ncbi:hypothetical protein MFM001_33750 [Mycobacterium sp. MFM001]|nr:hypothetical protein MFM001_33750 [Mycobacterium sp. MFM001]
MAPAIAAGNNRVAIAACAGRAGCGGAATAMSAVSNAGAGSRGGGTKPTVIAMAR